MKLKFLATIVFATLSGSAFAFPIAAGAVAGGALGALLLPMLALVLGTVWLIKTKGKGVGAVLMILAMSCTLMLLHKDFTSSRMAEVNLYKAADSSWFKQPIPFHFLEPDLQARSRQAVSPEEFLHGLREGHFKALRLTSTPGLFTADYQVGASDIWGDKTILKTAVEALGGRVVLVDQHGGIAGSVAELARSELGLDMGFLQGGTNALSAYGWESLQDAFSANELPAVGYQQWLDENPDAYVIALTTEHEFVSDGWQFGDRTLSMADFVTHFDSLKDKVGGKAFVAGFESNDIGATAVALSMLQGAGIDTFYVRPDPDEVLIKDPYVTDYLNNDRLVTIDDAKRYIQHRDDVAFLDFSERRWELADKIGEAYHHIPMTAVAAGNLQKHLDDLDLNMNYIGLGFDRRTSYHSLIAGAYLVDRGAGWLGRFTLPDLLSDELFDNEEFVSPAQTLAYQVKTALGKAGGWMLSSNVAFLFASVVLAGCLILMSFWPGKFSSMAGSIVTFMVIELVILGANDYPVSSSRISAFASVVTCLFAIWCLAKRWTPQPVFPASSDTTALPPKAANLKAAADRGYVVPQTKVYTVKDDYHSIPVLMDGKLMVRSAFATEADNHSSTAGVFHSELVDDSHGVIDALVRVFSSGRNQSYHGGAMVQQFVEADWYGVAQFQENHQSKFIVCEHGAHGAVTSGVGEVERFVIPLTKCGLAASPMLPRKVAEALIDLLKMDAYSIEYALTNAGELTILQVNTDQSRASAARKMLELRDVPFREVASQHSNPLSAAVIAAMQPGDMVAYGNRRFIRKVSFPVMMTRVISDLRHFNFRALTSYDQMIAWLDDAHHPHTGLYDLSGVSSSVVDQVVNRLRYISNTYGRLNRLATTAMQLGKTGSWVGKARTMPTTTLRKGYAGTGALHWNGLYLSSLSSFDAYAKDQSLCLEDIGSVCTDAPTPAAYVKDASTFMMMVELGAMREALNHIIGHGKEADLMARLETQVGYWSPNLSCDSAPVSLGDLPLLDLIDGHDFDSLAIHVPSKGIQGPVTMPGSYVDGGILVIPSCSMDYLPLLEKAKAVVALSGSVTSHLMQHAAAMGKPVVITNELPTGFQAGDLLSIDSKGRVCCA